ncbi:MAG: radical SAM protein [Anaerolineae bacterium]|nr:radical SAM protein [Anaerolineae bacterium]
MKLSHQWTDFLNKIRRGDGDGPHTRTLSHPSGLLTYPIQLDGGQRRIHLRIHKDGSGVLFIDVTEVIHLNPTAVQMVKLALDGIPKERAEARLARQYRGVTRTELSAALNRMYEMVERLRENVDGCPTCAIAADVEFQPLFSTPVTAPYKADVALTYACNNACPHCYNEPGRFTMATLADEEWFRVFDKLNAIGIPHLILTGGEPTLLPQLPDLVRYANRLGHIVGMNTNGRRLADDQLAQRLADAGLNHVQITLESHSPAVHDAMVATEGAFEETLAGIRSALQSGLHTITNTTLTRQNQDHAVDIVGFLDDVGLKTFAMNGMIYAGGGTATPDAIPVEEMASLLVAIRDEATARDMRFLWYTVTDYCRLSPLELGLSPKRCNAAEYSICIEPNGDVLPCQSYYVSAGNILNDPWDAIWNSELFLSFRDRETNPEAAGLPTECWDCPDLEMCGGGCRLEREARSPGGIRAAEHGCARTGASTGAHTLRRASGESVAPILAVNTEHYEHQPQR